MQNRWNFLKTGFYEGIKYEGDNRGHDTAESGNHPVEVRRLLGLKPRDEVAFTIEGGEVRWAASSFSLESGYGSVQPSRNPEDFDKVSQDAKEAKAQETTRELSGARGSWTRTSSGT